MERFHGRDFVAHLITDPKSETPRDLKKAVKDALENNGGVIIKPADGSEREIYSSASLKTKVKDPTPEEIERYHVAVALRIVLIGQSATLFEYTTSS